MAKLDPNYLSLFDYLRKQDISFIRWIYKYFYDNELYPTLTQEQLHASEFVTFNQVLGAFHPLKRVYKEIVDSNKVYKDREGVYYARRDFFTPFYGLGNLAGGLLKLLGTAGVFTVRFIQSVIESDSLGEFATALKKNVVHSLSWLFDGVSTLVYGALQTVAAPFVWLGKMPRRIYLTFKNPAQLIKHNPGMQRELRSTLVFLAELGNKKFDSANQAMLRLGAALHEVKSNPNPSDKAMVKLFTALKNAPLGDPNYFKINELSENGESGKTYANINKLDAKLKNLNRKFGKAYGRRQQISENLIEQDDLLVTEQKLFNALYTHTDCNGAGSPRDCAQDALGDGSIMNFLSFFGRSEGEIMLEEPAVPLASQATKRAKLTPG